MTPHEAPYTVRRESIAIERTLSDVRVVLCLATAGLTIPLWLTSGIKNPWQVVILGLFVVYSGAMWIGVRWLQRYLKSAILISSLVEVLLITAFISALQQTVNVDQQNVGSIADYFANYGSARSPLYLWYVFYIASISLRYGMDISIIGLSASVVLYTAVSLIAPTKPIFSSGFMGDTGFLFILAFLFGHIAERQRSYQTRLAVVNELGVALASLGTSREIVRLMVAQTAELLNAEMCWFVQSRNDVSTDDSIVIVGVDSDVDLRDLGGFAPERVIECKCTVVSNNSRKDGRVPPTKLKQLRLKNIAAVPLSVRDVPVGVLYAANKSPRGFAGYDVELLDLIAAQAAPIIENTQLWERLKEAAAAEERLRIARDLHDNFLQTLSAIKLHLETSRLQVDRDPQKAKSSIERIHQISTEGLAEVRSYLSQLRLVGPDPARFGEAAERCASEAASRGGFIVHTDIDIPDDIVTPQISLAAFQVLRELLNNIVKHASAQNVWVKIDASDTVLKINVRDDGCGFDIEEGKRASERGHLGLVGVTERVSEFNGTFEVTSCLGQGTNASVVFNL